MYDLQPENGSASPRFKRHRNTNNKLWHLPVVYTGRGNTGQGD